MSDDTTPALVARDPLTADVLPRSIARKAKRRTNAIGMVEVNLSCANCGVDMGWVPEPSEHFAFALCDEDRNYCAGTWGPLIGSMVVPHERFWEIARQEQLERLGRVMTPLEVAKAIDDVNHWIHKLLREETRIIQAR